MSDVWNYFIKTAEDKAKCKLRGKYYSCKLSSTKGLWNHVKSIHKDVLEKDQENGNAKENKARFTRYSCIVNNNLIINLYFFRISEWN